MRSAVLISVVDPHSEDKLLLSFGFFLPSVFRVNMGRIELFSNIGTYPAKC